MRAHFDNGPPRGIAAALQEHTVEEARSRGWDSFRNGELLEAAERAGFDVVVATDRNIRHQQNLAGRRIAIVVLSKGRGKPIRSRLPEIATAVGGATAGSFTEVDIPLS